ncbi:MAG: OB-fold nucleic acid binding domain-containing protein [Candidatus Bathyarchaeia archaeon]
MGIDSMIEAILTVRKDLTRSDVLKMIEDKKREFLGFLSDEGAALILAQELGIAVEPESREYSEVKISSLTPGLRSVTVKGRIVLIREPSRFRREYGGEGVVQRVTIMDYDGSTIDIVLWDENVEKFNRLCVGYGSTIRVKSGYTKEGLGGRVELHVGRRGDIEVIEKYDGEYKFTFICDLKPGGYFNVKGILCMVYPMRGIKEGGAIKPIRARIADETGWINLIVWDVKAAELLSYNPGIGAGIRVYNGFAKRKTDGTLELHVGRIGRIEVVGECNFLPLKYAKISQLKPESRVDMLLRLLTYNVRKLRSNGRRVKMLAWDGESTIRLTVWEEALISIEDLLDKLKPNDLLLVQLGKVSDRTGIVEVQLDSESSLYVNPPFIVESPPLYQFKSAKVGELREGLIYASVSGITLTKPSIREVGSDDRKVRISTVRIGDETGIIDVTLWGEHADKVLDVDIGELIDFRWIIVKKGSDNRVEVSTTIFSDIVRLGRFTSTSTL